MVPADRLQLGAQLSDEAVAFLAEDGYDPAYGARPLKRSIQRHLLDPLSLSVLDGEFPPGSVIKVTLKDGALAFE